MKKALCVNAEGPAMLLKSVIESKSLRSYIQ